MGACASQQQQQHPKNEANTAAAEEEGAAASAEQVDVRVQEEGGGGKRLSASSSVVLPPPEHEDVEQQFEELLSGMPPKTRQSMRALSRAKKWQLVQQSRVVKQSASHGADTPQRWAATLKGGPSVQDLRSLRVVLNSHSGEWVSQLEKEGGVDALLGVYTACRGSEHGGEMQLEVLRCVKTVMDTEAGLRMLMTDADSGQSRVEQCVMWLNANANEESQRILVDLLTVVCWISEEGHQMLVGALNEYRVRYSQANMWSVLAKQLNRTTKNVVFKNSVLTLINAVLNQFHELDDRVLYRNLLLDCELGKSLHSLREWTATQLETGDEDFARLQIQMDLFENEMAEDDRMVTLRGLNLSSVTHVFKYLRRLTKDKGLSEHLLAVMQALTVLPSSPTDGRKVWGAASRMLQDVAKELHCIHNGHEPESDSPLLSYDHLKAALREKMSEADDSDEVAEPEKAPPPSEEMVKLQQQLQETQTKLKQMEQSVAAVVTAPAPPSSSPRGVTAASAPSPPPVGSTAPAAAPPPPLPADAVASNPPPIPAAAAAPPPGVCAAPPPAAAAVGAAAPPAAAPPPGAAAAAAPPPAPAPGGTVPPPAPAGVPVPPPLGGKGVGGPPLAPPLGGLGAAASYKPKRKPIKPRVKMRQFHWSTVPVSKLQHSMWDASKPLDEAVKLDIDELESTFMQKLSTAKSMTPSRSSMSKKQELVALVDPKRSYNIDIGLSRFNMSHEQIRDAILSMDERLSSDQVSKLIHFVPTADEVDLVTSYDGAASALGNTEKLFLILSPIPDIRPRLQLLLFRLQYEDLMEELERNVAAVQRAHDAVLRSRHLKRVFSCVLAVGNYLNGGTAKGGAYGFRLSSLKQLGFTKSQDGKQTLLHYLISHVTRHDKDALAFTDDLVPCEEAVRVESSALAQEVGGVRMNLRKLDTMLRDAKPAGTKDRFQPIMSKFLSSAQPRFDKLQHTVQRLGEGTQKLAQSFGEGKDAKWEQLFAVFHQFRVSWLSAAKEMELAEAKRVREEKRKTVLKRSPPKRRIEVPPEEAKSLQVPGKNVVENVLGSLTASDSAELGAAIRKRRQMHTRRKSSVPSPPVDQKKPPTGQFQLPALHSVRLRPTK